MTETRPLIVVSPGGPSSGSGIYIWQKVTTPKYDIEFGTAELISCFFLLKNAFAISKLDFQWKNRVANVSFEVNVYQHVKLPENLASFGCRRAGDIVLPSFLPHIESIGECM